MSDRVSGELWASRMHNLTPPRQLGVNPNIFPRLADLTLTRKLIYDLERVLFIV